MPGTVAQDALGVAVDRREHLVGAEALDEPDRRDRADVLDALEVGAHRVVADRLEHAHAVGAETASRGAAWRRQPPPTATDSPSWTCAERADEHDLLALVGDGVEHREVAVGRRSSAPPVTSAVSSVAAASRGAAPARVGTR